MHHTIVAFCQQIYFTILATKVVHNNLCKSTTFQLHFNIPFYLPATFTLTCCTYAEASMKISVDVTNINSLHITQTTQSSVHQHCISHTQSVVELWAKMLRRPRGTVSCPVQLVNASPIVEVATKIRLKITMSRLRTI